MLRSRGWFGAGAAAVAAVGAVALAWPAIPAAGSGGSGGSGTLAVSSSGTVTASLGTTLTFSFTAPANPPSPDVIVTLFMPTGWTASPPSLADLTCPNSACSLGPATSTQFEVVMFQGATTFTLVVQATPPGSAGSYSFTATERFHSNPPATLDVMSAPVTVVCPADGLGTMAVNPSTAAVASSGTFTFTYTAGSCTAGADGVVGVTVPGGWTPPGPATAPAGSLTPGARVTFTYGPAQVGSAGPATFSAWQSAAGGRAQDLAAAPVIMVTQPQVTTSSASTSPSSQPPSSAQSPTSAQSPSSGARSSGPSTVASSPVRSSPALGGAAGGQPVALVAGGLSAGGLVLLAGLAGLLASRSRRRAGRLRRGGHGAGGGDVRAVPHAGPPPSVSVRDTGTRPALTVRIEPHAGATVTTIEEKRP